MLYFNSRIDLKIENADFFFAWLLPNSIWLICHVVKPTFTYLITYIFLDGEICGKTYYTLSSTETTLITSPGYPAEYFNNINCYWHISTYTTERILLEIVELELERGFDTLIVKDEIVYTYHLIVALTGTVKLHTIASTEDSLYLEFYSDTTGSGKGFRVNLRKFTNAEGEFR